MNAAVNHICVYNNCFKNQRVNKHVSFFKFPIKDIFRAKEWKKNCGNGVIELMNIVDLKNKLICEEHFLPKDIRISNRRKLLSKTAVPRKFIEKDNNQYSCEPSGSSQPIKKYTRKRNSDEDDLDINDLCTFKDLPRTSSVCSTNSSESKVSDGIIQTESPSKTILKMRCSVLSSKLQRLKSKIRARQSQIYRLKMKKSLSTNQMVNNLFVGKSKYLQVFVGMQLFCKRNVKWTKAQKQLSLSLYYKSPAAYKFMLNNLKFTLPSIRTIQSWLKVESDQFKNTMR